MQMQPPRRFEKPLSSHQVLKNISVTRSKLQVQWSNRRQNVTQKSNRRDWEYWYPQSCQESRNSQEIFLADHPKWLTKTSSPIFFFILKHHFELKNIYHWLKNNLSSTKSIFCSLARWKNSKKYGKKNLFWCGKPIWWKERVFFWWFLTTPRRKDATLLKFWIISFTICFLLFFFSSKIFY